MVHSNNPSNVEGEGGWRRVMWFYAPTRVKVSPGASYFK
jgi:hypothetical protein